MAKKSRSLFRRQRSSKSVFGKQPRRIGSSALTFETLESRQLLAVTSFQDGVNSYEGTEDTILFSGRPNTNFASETAMSPDQQDANAVRQGLLKFDDIFGNNPGQIPLGSTIQSATLTVHVTNPSDSQMQMSLYRILQPWSQSTATWNNPFPGSGGIIGGVQASEGEATSLPPDSVLFDPRVGTSAFDVTRSLQNWAAGQDNQGWLIESAATDGWDFDTSEAAVADRPKLTVTYTPPAGPGQIQFIESKVRQAEGDADNVVAVTVSRLGGVTGSVSATYTVAAGTAQANDFVADSGIITFADGETSKTINVTLKGDTALEGNETITVSLSGPNVGTNSQLTMTIADDDALINEVLANITAGTVGSPLYNETNLEYVELIGTPGASLNDYFFVVFEGQEEENGGTGSGIADVVINLAGQTFGSNGLLLITGNDFGMADINGTPTQLPGFVVDPNTTRLVVPGFSLEDNSQTYALVRSTVPIVQGTDYDTVGTYTSGALDALDSPLGAVGVLDVGPFLPGGGAQIVDSAFVQQGSADRDRAAVTADLGLPGVHLHQPSRSEGSELQTSDAISRREGNKQPNTIGAWFNGDITDTNAQTDPIPYLNGTTRISVVAPPGSVLTPGKSNTLRNVFVSADAVSFDESAGTATFTITRTGDTSQPLSVDYTTVNGTAVAGSDFTAKSGTVNFAADGNVTQQSQQIVIALNDDGIAEGFETFGLQISNAGSPFLITGSLAIVTINDANVSVATFQQGVNGYSGNLSNYIDGSQPNFFFGFSDRVIVDDAAGDPEFGGAEGADIRPQQGMIRFNDIFGSGVGQVPTGAQIFGGFLTLNVLAESSDSATIELFRMLRDWDDLGTWTDPQGSVGASILNGVTPDGLEAYYDADSQVTLPAVAGTVEVPISATTLQAWATGALDNFGWNIVSNSDESWEFSSAFAPFPELRPELTILYTDPAGAGSFSFAESEVAVAEGDAATITVQRVGGSTGAASIDYAISLGTAQAGDFSGPTSGTLNFAAGELSKTITIPTVQDNTSEIDETLIVSLTGNVVPGSGPATAKIRNNDVNVFSPPVLVNEIVYNQPGNDGGGEFFELAGTPGAALGGLYAVVIAGDIGADQGATDLVVDLGAYFNGANGTTLIGARDTFIWDIPAGTTFIGLEELNSEALGGNDNGTSTYALVYSPVTPLHVGRFDYDFDNDGSLDLPAGAVIVDSIGVRDENSTGSDTTYGPGSNAIQPASASGEAYDAVSRLPGTTARNSAASWFVGDILGADDALVYNPAVAANLPSTGAAATPGLLNTGNNAANPLATVASVNVTSGVVVNFTGTVNQVLLGDNSSFTGSIGPGISVTNTDGSEIAGVNPVAIVSSGIGTNSLTLSFAGPATTGGQLPAGAYHLNFVANSVVVNGRALDAANTGSPSNASIEITVTAPVNDADFNDSGLVDGFDFLAWQRGYGQSGTGTHATGDANNDSNVNAADLDVWQAQYGASPALAASESLTVAAAPAVPEQSVVGEFTLAADGWLALPPQDLGSTDRESGVGSTLAAFAVSPVRPTTESSDDSFAVRPSLSEIEDFEVEEYEEAADEAFAELGDLLFV